MKLIIPMAGRGTRVRPHSHTIPKPLLPVAGTMIVERIVETFGRTLDQDITDIIYILGPDFGQEIKNRLSDMSARHNAKAHFKIQHEALGTAHAVACAEEHLGGEILVAFADTIFDSKDTFKLGDADSVIWLKRVEDPSRFGVAVHEGDTITGFVEKPKEFISDLAIIGVYYFKDSAAFYEQLRYVIDNNIKGPGGEFFLTAALDRMIKQGKVFKTATVDEWLDCGTLEAWRETTGLILEKENHSFDEHQYPGSKIIPPVFIGSGVEIQGSTIGPKVSIEAGSNIKNSTISDSIVQSNTTIENAKLSSSTVGNHANIHNVEGEIHLGDHSILKL